MNTPVITIDGPSASGKGTVAQLVAKQLGYHYLDSGALYRLVALKAMQSNINFSDEVSLANIAQHLNVIFENDAVLLEQKDVTLAIREEQCGIHASQLAALPQVRQALVARQRAFCQTPGLVTDGRDMGSVIFPQATLKIFLTASAEVRAQRRHKQLMEKEISANIIDLLKAIQERDSRDQSRSVAPLQQNADTRLLDTTLLSIKQAADKILAWHQEVCTK